MFDRILHMLLAAIIFIYETKKQFMKLKAKTCKEVRSWERQCRSAGVTINF